MRDEGIASDLEIEQAPLAELSYGWSLLMDLEGEFQGSAWAFGALSVIIPVGTMASLVFEWSDSDPTWRIFLALVLTVVCITVAVHSWTWLRWVRRRLRMIELREE